MHALKELVSDTASQLLESTQAEQVSSSVVRPNGVPSAEISDGAMKK